ncbi:MAG: hypothetical protein Q9180_000613 [Flavoplaca navasiana]
MVRCVSRNKVFNYPEEDPNFHLPESYHHPDSLMTYQNSPESPQIPDASQAGSAGKTGESSDGLDKARSNVTLSEKKSRPIAPTVSKDGTILVDWYSTDDPANPQNWSSWKKVFVAFQLCLYTFAIYLASAIYTPSEPGVMIRFGVGSTAAALGLSMYVLGYGIGPLLWSPMSEIPVIGRNPPYIATFAIFVILCLPTALADNFAGLLVLRFLHGYFGSPALATGGATMGDMYSLLKLPYLLTFWVAAATCGPALGPIVSGFSVPAKDWRWSLWEILWLAAPVFLLLFFCMPETSSSNILLRRARRLRKLTGNDHLRSQSEITQAKLTFREIAVGSLWRPIQIFCLDPAVFFAGVYTSLVYGIYYSFFEVFPLVYIDIYNFNFGQMGLTFLSISVATPLAIIAYCSYLYFILEPSIKAHGFGSPERRLIPALYTACLLPVGLFIFGWTARANVHWMVSVVGIGIYSFGVFTVLQCIFFYLPLIYPQYAASLFAGNDLTRSALAAGAILFAKPLYRNLGIGEGVSLLAAFTVVCIGGIFALYFYGARLRARSRFAVKE